MCSIALWSPTLIPSQMLNLDLLGNGDGRPCPVKPESIARAVEGLEGPRRHFIRLCLSVDPSQRHTASALLKLPVLQEVRGGVCVWIYECECVSGCVCACVRVCVSVSACVCV